MNEPITPTGKRHAARADDPEQGYSAISSREIAAIEREKEAQVLERLRHDVAAVRVAVARKSIKGWSDETWLRWADSLLADPEPDR